MTEIGPLVVSTIFLGFGGDDPVLFETLVFDGIEPCDGRRYTTCDAAERGHTELVAVCRERLVAAERLL